MYLVYSILNQASEQANNPTTSTNDSGAALGWLLGFGIATLTVVMVVRPLVLSEVGLKRRKAGSLSPLDSQLESLQDSAAAEHQSLQDLDFDREIGIIEEKDYTELYERTEQKLTELNTRIAGLQHRRNGHSVTTLKASGSPGKAPTLVSAKPTSGSATRPGKLTPTESERLRVKPTVKEKLKCDECGTSFNPGDRFCRQCSAPLPIICLNCGKEVTQDDRFCAKCGAAVNT